MDTTTPQAQSTIPARLGISRANAIRAEATATFYAETAEAKALATFAMMARKGAETAAGQDAAKPLLKNAQNTLKIVKMT